jgi:hypothetical protein
MWREGNENLWSILDNIVINEHFRKKKGNTRARKSCISKVTARSFKVATLGSLCEFFSLFG